jgi:SNF2 family DNA or RNA helicase
MSEKFCIIWKIQIMGTLTYSKGIFRFSPHGNVEARKAADAGLMRGEGLQWLTRSFEKARQLRGWADDSAEMELKRRFTTCYPAPDSIPYPDHLEPRVFQLESAWHCLTRSPAYCADDQGLGKTITSCLCMNAVPGRILIICPPHLVHNWVREIVKWHHDGWPTIIKSGDESENSFKAVVLICPDSLIINERIYGLLMRQSFLWAFVDEVHRFTHDSQRTLALFGGENESKKEQPGLITRAKRVVYLSGTPVPNGKPIELYPMLSRTASESIKHRTLIDYGRAFCNGRKLTHFEKGRAVVNWDFQGCSNLKRLNKELFASLMIRHEKQDVLKELGPKTRKLVFLDAPKELEPFERAALKDRTLDELLGDDHTLGDVATYRREVGEHKILPAFEYIKELLDTSPDKLVVFAHHVAVVEMLAQLLGPYGCLMIRGGMSKKAKAQAVEAFQTKAKHRVVAGNMESMGTGNTMTAAPGVVVVEPSWVPGINEQAEDRVYRMTQKQNVYVRYLVMRGTLDERMLTRVFEKGENIKKVMKGKNK